MGFVRYLLALVVLAIVASAKVEGHKGLYEVCNNLNYELGRTDISLDDHEAVFAFAKDYILSFVHPPTALQRRKLVSVWQKVINKPECSSSLLDELRPIGRCNLPNNRNLRTFSQAAKSYFDKCLTPEFFEKKIKSVAVGTFKTAFHGDVRQFLDRDFLQDYRADHPREAALQIGAGGMGRCCEPKDAALNIVRAIDRDMQKKGKTAKEEFARQDDKLWDYLKSKLFTPCKYFYEALDEVMYVIGDGEDMIEGGYRGLAAAMGQDGKDEAFRYSFCQRLRYERRQQALLDDVLAALE